MDSRRRAGPVKFRDLPGLIWPPGRDWHDLSGGHAKTFFLQLEVSWVLGPAASGPLAAWQALRTAPARMAVQCHHNLDPMIMGPGDESGEVLRLA
jgi:hypothetical protein